jgi:hypothetical protein
VIGGDSHLQIPNYKLDERITINSLIWGLKELILCVEKRLEDAYDREFRQKLKLGVQAYTASLFLQARTQARESDTTNVDSGRPITHVVSFTAAQYRKLALR